MNYVIKINGKEHYKNVTARLEKIGIKSDGLWNIDNNDIIDDEDCHVCIEELIEYQIHNHCCSPAELVTIEELEKIMKKDTIIRNEPIFKEGDRVYHILYGWGVITNTNVNCHPKIYIVDFIDGDALELREYELSFTEYTLQNFSQERPINWNDYVGEWGYLYNSKDDYKCFGKLIAYRGNVTYPFYTNGRWGESWFENFQPLTPELKELLIKENIIK